MNTIMEENTDNSDKKEVESKPNELAGFYFSSSVKITDPNTKKALMGIAKDVATIANAKKLTGGKSTGANPVPSAGSGMVGGMKPTS
jgi:hypothetical protein